MTKKKPPELLKKAGRPSKYRPDHHPEAARKLAVLGCIDTEIAQQFELSETQLNAWKRKYPEFAQSIREGRIPTNAAVADSLRQRALGFEWEEEVPTKVRIGQYEEKVVITKVKRVVPPDTNAISLFLRNRESQKWRDKVEVEHSGTVGTRAARIKAGRQRAGVADGDSATGA